MAHTASPNLSYGDRIPPSPVLVEACVDSLESALAAEAGGARRVELCDNLAEGGTTPSAGAIEACCERLGIPVFVMIRPRGGDFLYSDAEFEVMRRDIGWAKRLGAHGVVFGLLRQDGSIDVERTRILVEESRPCAVTFHRAFDVCRDRSEALELLIDLGIERVLTSGQAPTALEGSATIAELVHLANGRIGVLPGGGVDEDNVGQIVATTAVREVHVRSTVCQPSPMRYRNPRIDFSGRAAISNDVREVTDAARVRRLIQSIPIARNHASS
jgi:copper homeostasis protein